MAKAITRYHKITTGFVVQVFEKIEDKFICTEQTFVAGDTVDRENPANGDSVPADQIKNITRNEVYQPFLMIQPHSQNS